MPARSALFPCNHFSPQRLLSQIYFASILISSPSFLCVHASLAKVEEITLQRHVPVSWLLFLPRSLRRSVAHGKLSISSCLSYCLYGPLTALDAIESIVSDAKDLFVQHITESQKLIDLQDPWLTPPTVSAESFTTIFPGAYYQPDTVNLRGQEASMPGLWC